MYGDYSQYQKWNASKTTDFFLAAAAAGQAAVIAPKSANHQLFIQKIVFNVSTAAAQSIIFRDSNGTPLVIGTVPASQSTPLTMDFGPKGVALTTGKNLDISNTAGPAGMIHIEAYEKIGNGLSNSNGTTATQ